MLGNLFNSKTVEQSSKEVMKNQMLEASKTGQDTGRLIDQISSVLEIWTTSSQMCLKLPDYVHYADAYHKSPHL